MTWLLLTWVASAGAQTRRVLLLLLAAVAALLWWWCRRRRLCRRAPLPLPSAPLRRRRQQRTAQRHRLSLPRLPRSASCHRVMRWRS
jgi:hypothetical protein